MLTPENVVLAETGDSWFNCQKLRLPEGCGFEFQMQYGSIGWAVGATLGYAQAAGKDKRVISCIGDGSFQVMLGNRMPPVLLWNVLALDIMISVLFPSYDGFKQDPS